MQLTLRLILTLWLACCLRGPVLSCSAVAQAPAEATLQGVVTDPAGAAVPGAVVVLTRPGGQAATVITGTQGHFRVVGLQPGTYTITAVARGFARTVERSIAVRAGAHSLAPIRLAFAVASQQVEVRAQAAQVELSPAANASAVSLSGSALSSLPEDPDELLADLMAMAGPAAGAAGSEVYVNGFTGADMPAKGAIRSVRINENPYSARYDRLGYGRMDIETKAGGTRLHGHASLDANASALNSRSPFLTGSLPAYHSGILGASLGGPVGKKTSFYFDFERRDIEDRSVVNAEVLDANLYPVAFSASVANPRLRKNLSGNVEYDATANNTLLVRYQYVTTTETGNDIGAQLLPSQGLDAQNQHHLLMLSDTAIVSPHVVNQARFQFLQFANRQTSQQIAPTLEVIGAFTGGGNSIGTYNRSETHNEAQDYVTLADGSHNIGFGGFVQALRRREMATSGFNGTFVFNSLAGYQAAEQALAAGANGSAIVAAGYGPSQFSINEGSPVAAVMRLQGAFYAEDNWAARRNLTLSYGLRLESQNGIADHLDWAPRLGLSWGLGRGTPKTVVRAGFGVFYERVDDDQMIQAARLNGTSQRQYLVADPTFFPNVPPATVLAAQNASLPAVYRIAPGLHAPYALESGISVERQLSRDTALSVNYVRSAGEDQLLSNDINAPLLASGVRPLGVAAGNIYEYEAAGIFRQNQLTVNFRSRAGKRATFSGYYSFNDAHSDTAGPDSFPANPWNIPGDFGRAAYDVRHRVFFSGFFQLPAGFSASPFVLVNSGVPFSITVSEDLFGTGIHNVRPAYATPGTPAADVRSTAYGSFDLHPAAGQALIPPNTATGPVNYTLNLRLTPQFELRHGSALAVGVLARNLLNHANLAPPLGDLNSPLFGQSIALAGGSFSSQAASRRIDLVASFDF